MGSCCFEEIRTVPIGRLSCKWGVILGSCSTFSQRAAYWPRHPSWVLTQKQSATLYSTPHLLFLSLVVGTNLFFVSTLFTFFTCVFFHHDLCLSPLALCFTLPPMCLLSLVMCFYLTVLCSLSSTVFSFIDTLCYFVFLNFYGAQESIPRNEFGQPTL
jgi:hypothetical protein